MRILRGKNGETPHLPGADVGYLAKAIHRAKGIMLNKLLQLLGVRCGHRRLSHPFAAATIKSSKSDDWDAITEVGGHYVVCLDCGKKFAYDWAKMRVIW